MSTRAAFALLLALCLGGCEDVADRLSQPLRREPPQAHVFAGEPKAVYAAARSALDAMDYRFVRGGAAQGSLEAVSAIVPGDAPGADKQVTLRAEFRPAEAGGTEVSVRVTQVAERDGADASAAPGSVAESSVGTAPIYDVFFRAVQQKLNEANK